MKFGDFFKGLGKPPHPDVVPSTVQPPRVLYLGLPLDAYQSMQTTNTFKAESPRRVDLTPRELWTMLGVTFDETEKAARTRAGGDKKGVVVKVNGHMLGATYPLNCIKKVWYVKHDIPNASKYIEGVSKTKDPDDPLDGPVWAWV